MKSGFKLVLGLILIVGVILGVGFLSAMVIKATSIFLIILLSPLSLLIILSVGCFIGENVVNK